MVVRMRDVLATPGWCLCVSPCTLNLFPWMHYQRRSVNCSTLIVIVWDESSIIIGNLVCASVVDLVSDDDKFNPVDGLSMFIGKCLVASMLVSSVNSDIPIADVEPTSSIGELLLAPVSDPSSVGGAWITDHYVD